jgi:hypothetical protein
MTAPAPITILDGVEFETLPADREVVRRNGVTIGEIELDEFTRHWVGRRLTNGEAGLVRSLRSLAEARAFIIGAQLNLYPGARE